MINSCKCSYCKKWHSHISYGLDGKSICVYCKRKKLKRGVVDERRK